MKTLVTGAFPLTDDIRSSLEKNGLEIVFHADEREPVEHPEGYEAVICNGLFLYSDIRQFSNLKKIQLTSAGFDRAPMDYTKEHGIKVFNADGVYSIPMAEFAISGILQLYKQSGYFLENKLNHRWEKHRGLREISGKTAVIVGTGNVGTEIAKRLQAFGCRVIGVNRTVCKTEWFKEVYQLGNLKKDVKSADVLFLTIALTEETEYLISEEVLSEMKDDAVIVNVSRGKTVKQSALIQWLQDHPRGGAVLDVFEEEPLNEKSQLWEMQNVILTPHNSFVGEHNTERLLHNIYNNLCL